MTVTALGSLTTTRAKVAVRTPMEYSGPLCIASHWGAEKYASPISLSSMRAQGLQMRIGIGIAVVVAVGLIWSIAVMSQWVPMASAEMRSVAFIQPFEAGRR